MGGRRAARVLVPCPRSARLVARLIAGATGVVIAIGLGAGVVGFGLGAGGCTRTFHGAVAQPNPLITPTEVLRISEPITIVTGDMDLNRPRPQGAVQHGAIRGLERYPLQNVASFTLVSRDRLRVHVQLEHKWEEWADVRSWEVFLIDDQGRRWAPASVERARTRHLVSMWDQEVRSVRRNSFGDIVEVADDGWRRRQTLGSLSVFRGRGDFVFYEHDLFTPSLRWLRLVVRRPGQAFEFTWAFTDDAIARR